MRTTLRLIFGTAARRLVLPILTVTLVATPAFTQSLNYIDEAGNIHFVDNLNEVPMQYRNQFVPPQPTLQPGSKAAREYEKSIKVRERELEIAKKKKEKEDAKKKKLADKERKKKEKEKAREKKRKKSSKDK